MVATISADLVRSTSLRTKDLIELRDRLLGLLDDLERNYQGFWARVVRGDCIECYVPQCHDALRIAILIKLFVKIQVNHFECSEILKKYGIRFSIGIADLKYVNRADDIIDGNAIYISGRNLDAIGKCGNIYTAIELAGVSYELNSFFDSYIAMIGNLVDSYSAKQAEVVFLKLLGFKERLIGERLGIFQSSVNTRSTKAQWALLNTAIKDFENINFESLCG